jgi:hypothetical protein
MHAEPLEFRHRDVLSQRLKDLKVPLSEYSFANLYLFRRVHAYEVVFGDHLFIRGRAYDGSSFVMPTEPFSRMGAACLQEQLADADHLFPVPEAWLSQLPSDLFEAEFREGDADYVYTVEKMGTYAGRKLHKKRNLLKQFTAGYQHEALPLTAGRIADALAVLDAWVAETSMDPKGTDAGPCREALERYDDLMLCGGIVYAEGEPAGFVLGEEAGEDTYVLHFAKALTKFKGVYQYLFNSFAKVLPPKYRFLNLEQDLEQENLRVFKSSYVPDRMLRKARVRLKQGR